MFFLWRFKYLNPVAAQNLFSSSQWIYKEANFSSLNDGREIQTRETYLLPQLFGANPVFFTCFGNQIIP